VPENMSRWSIMIVGAIALSLMAFGAIAVILDPKSNPGHIGVHIETSAPATKTPATK